MFDRPTYKKAAKKQLKGRWAFPVVMTLITAVLLSLLGVINYGGTRTGYGASVSYGVSLQENALTIPVICILGILTLAQTCVYLRLFRTTEKTSFGDFLSGLSHWLSGALGGLWYALWVFLWSLLFVIPGIVKAFAYSQMFFVLAENPGIGVRKAMNISKVITQGHKGDLFIMGISFFGWMLLCTLSCGIGCLWLLPYMNMTQLNAYFALKNMAIAANKITLADFTPAEVLASEEESV